MITAQFIKKVGRVEGWQAGCDARLYKLSQPVPCRVFSLAGASSIQTSYIVISATIKKDNTPVTDIFSTDEQGHCIITRLLKMDGSLAGELNHEKAIRNAGFSLIS